MASLCLCLAVVDGNRDASFALACVATVSAVLLLFPLILVASVTWEYFKQPPSNRKSWSALLHDHWFFDDSGANSSNTTTIDARSSPRIEEQQPPPPYDQVNDGNDGGVPKNPLEKADSVASTETVPPTYDDAASL